MTDTFFSRWSRRKDEARRAAEAPAEAEPQGAAPEPRALTEEEIAELPKIESLSAESDIAVFLRPGVPAALRKAALRRAWLVDPAIRDFVGPARDYDYDWNVPGAVPGYGPLSGEEIVAMARRVLGDPQPEETAEVQADVPHEQKS